MVLPYTDLLCSMAGKVLTAQSFWPLEAKFIHEGFTALTCPLTNGSARWNGLLQDSAHRGIHRAEEEFELRGALDLHQRVELMDLQASILLAGMSQQIGHDRLVVCNVSAQRNGNRLAEAMVGDRNALLSVELGPAGSQEQRQQQATGQGRVGKAHGGLLPVSSYGYPSAFVSSPGRAGICHLLRGP